MHESVREDREERFAKLYRRYRPQVLAYALRRIPVPDAAEVVAEAFTAAWRHLDTAPADPLPWLYRMAANAVSNQRRRNNRWLGLQDRAHRVLRPAVSPDPAIATVGMDALLAALSALSETDREVLRLVAWEGLEGAELALAMGCSTSAAKVRLHRARRRLGKLLDREDLAGLATTTKLKTITEVSR